MTVMSADQGASAALPASPNDWPKAIRARRRYLRMTQQELASEAGVSVSTIVRIENGRAGAEPYTLRPILEALQFDPHPADEPYDGTDRRRGERRNAQPSDDVDAIIAQIVRLSPQELAHVLLQLPEDKAQRVLAAYYQFLADRSAQSNAAERRIR